MSKNKRRLSIRLKMFLQITAILLTAVTVILVINTTYLGDLYLYNEKRKIASTAEYLNSLDLKSGVYLGTVGIIETENNISIDIYFPDGNPLYLSQKNLVPQGGNTVIIEHNVNSDGSVLDVRETNRVQYIDYTCTLDDGLEIEIFSVKANIDTNAGVALYFVWASILFIFVVVIIFLIIYSKSFTKPLIEMSKITEKMSNMDFSERLKVKSNDEIGELAGSINNLSSSLDSTLQDLNQKNQKLQDDIEKKQTLDDLRKEFISSISHELKTPIAIVRGYAEGAELMLQSGDTNGAAEYCDIIIKESDKMNALVFELLELSRFEIGDSRLEYEEFSLCDFVHDYIDSEKIVFEENGIKCETDIPSGVFCHGDLMKLNMVLNNYVSNAVSHADGEKLIKIHCEDLGEKVRIFVFNTGKTIADEDIDKIWDSFYRADKSRSRSEGRYGLGLSIVSAIQNLHGNEYGVFNSDGGVTFWFDIDKGKS